MPLCKTLVWYLNVLSNWGRRGVEVHADLLRVLGPMDASLESACTNEPTPLVDRWKSFEGVVCRMMRMGTMPGNFSGCCVDYGEYRLIPEALSIDQDDDDEEFFLTVMCRGRTLTPYSPRDPIQYTEATCKTPKSLHSGCCLYASLCPERLWRKPSWKRVLGDAAC
jgi:hypothetical protein